MSARNPWIVSFVVVTSLLSACGVKEADEEPEFTLDGVVEDTGVDTASWEFNADALAGEVTEQPDTSTPPDTQAADSGPAVVSSCAGRCGLKLESNPCHCDHGCLDRGDCCGDFEAACGCGVKKDCDDGNDCTTDLCESHSSGNKYCKQLPFFGCCNSDAECGDAGANKCVTPKCLSGNCSDVPKSCDDGVACTADSCDPATGACKNELPATKCLIDGACHGAGASKPGTGGCLLCQPDKDPAQWTSKAGSCFIDGACYGSGAKASPALDECRVCNPDVSGTSWSVSAGNCLIDGACYAAGTKNPALPQCAVCTPTQTQTAWSGVAGKCLVDGTCYSQGESPLGASCVTCQPDKSTSEMTLSTGACFIGGVCYSPGESDGTGCAICDTKTSTSAWTGLPPGSNCNDGSPCTIDTVCTPAGLCKGKTKPNCCETDVECVGKVPLQSCEKAVCKGNGTCEAQKDPLCCSSGKCCDLGTKTFKPKGTACSDLAIGVEYKCEGKTGYKRQTFPGCTGTHGSKCSQQDAAPGPWENYKTCSGATSCVVSSTTSPPVCK